MSTPQFATHNSADPTWSETPSTGPSYDRVATALETATDYRPKHKGGLWRCPSHHDKTPR